MGWYLQPHPTCPHTRTQVYAFLPPTRAVVADIVREKELRLREGMRVLGECPGRGGEGRGGASGVG